MPHSQAGDNILKGQKSPTRKAKLCPSGSSKQQRMEKRPWRPNKTSQWRQEPPDPPPLSASLSHSDPITSLSISSSARPRLSEILPPPSLPIAAKRERRARNIAKRIGGGRREEEKGGAKRKRREGGRRKFFPARGSSSVRPRQFSCKAGLSIVSMSLPAPR